jgi:hypothetical protein
VKQFARSLPVMASMASPTAAQRASLARGATEPVSGHSRRHFIAADGAIPNLAATARQLTPVSMAAIARCLGSRERGFLRKAGLLHRPPL